MIDTLTISDLIIKRINELCLEHNLTAYKIAKNGGFNPRTLNSFLNGTRKDIRISTVKNICDGIGISVSDFFNDDLFK